MITDWLNLEIIMLASIAKHAVANAYLVFLTFNTVGLQASLNYRTTEHQNVRNHH